MNIADEERFSSKPYTFIVAGKPYYVHAACVSACSAPLDRMISGNMSEAQQGFAVLEDVTQSTFARFVRWTYSRNYENPPHTIVTAQRPEGGASASEEADLPTAIDTEDWGGFGLTKKARKDKKKKREVSEVIAMKESFIGLSYDDLPSENTTFSAPRTNMSPEEDYTDVFRSHAELYVFAEKYDIQALKKLALRKLQQTLAIFTLYSERVEDILSLLRYVYTETAPTKNGEEDIRTMLMHYVGTEVRSLESHGMFKELLAEDNDMLGDFLVMLSRWIGSGP